jgi:hypothetical protein
MVMEEATLLMKINKNKNTARAIAKEKMIDEFLNKVATLIRIEYRDFPTCFLTIRLLRQIHHNIFYFGSKLL